MAKDHIEIINLKKRLTAIAGTIPTDISDLTDSTNIIPHTFLALNDTPATYVGQALKLVRVNAGATALEFYSLSIDQTKIYDGAGTTYVDTDETAGQVNIQAANTTTSTIFQIKSSSDLRFNVKGNGDIYNGTLEVYRYSNASLYLGIGTKATGNPANCVYVGFESGSANSNASGQNTGVGYQAIKNAIDVENAAFGYLAGLQTYQGKYNTFLGARAGTLNSSGSYNIYIGASAGRRQTTGSYQILMDYTLRATAAEELTNSIIYGIMAALPANQSLRVNAKLCVNVAPLTNMVAGDAVLEGGSLILKEITTPTADTNYGKVYTKSDNKIYFQSGDGVEHTIAFV